MMQGYYADPISIEFHPTHLTRASVTFPCGWDDEFNDALAEDMATGRISIEPLITHRIPFRTRPRRTRWCWSTPSVARHGAGLGRGLGAPLARTTRRRRS